METNKQYFDQIRGLIAKAQIDNAINELNQLFQHTPLWNEIIQQSFRWKDIAMQIRNGTISHQDATIDKNKIVYALNSLLDEMESSTEIPAIKNELSGAIKTVVKNSKNVVVGNISANKVDYGDKNIQNIYNYFNDKTHINQNQIEPIGAYHQLSCDRRQIIRIFDRVCDELREKGIKKHFFFIEGKLKGQATSLVKRLKIELGESRSGFKVGPKSDIEKDHKEVVSIFIDISQSHHDLVYDITKSFNRVYGIRPEAKSLGDIVKNSEKIKNFQSYDYLAFDIDISFPTSSWDKKVKPIIQWLIEDFARCEIDSNNSFLFFVILNVLDEQSPPKGIFSKIIRKKTKESFVNFQDTFDNFIRDFHNATFLPSLSLVSINDLAQWFTRFKGSTGDPRLEAEELAKKLPGNPPWHMTDVEIELREIVDTYRKKKYSI